MLKLFTADEHYGQKNGIHRHRGFATADDMVNAMIDNHNRKAQELGEETTTIHLGDIFWDTLRSLDALSILTRLRGDHALIEGNHEKSAYRLQENYNRGFYDKGFEWVKVREEITLRLPNTIQQWVVLDHYAGRVWKNSCHGWWQLYGHSHGKLAELENLMAFDVGVDPNGFTPLTEQEIVARMLAKQERLNALRQPLLDNEKLNPFLKDHLEEGSY